MKRSSLLAGMVMLALPGVAHGYGEGADIPEGARVIHLLTNEARTKKKNALKECGTNCSEGTDCFAEVLNPLYWDDSLFRAAQFHSVMLNAIDGGPKVPCMQHSSPCRLKGSIGGDYPTKCDGSPGCACEGGMATCGENGTSAGERVKHFAVTFTGENLASTSTPYNSFYLWLFEDAQGDGCVWSMRNGHRFNILGNSSSIGVGYTERREGYYYGITTQDFGNGVPEDASPLTAGAGFKAKDELWFKTQYFAETAARNVVVYVAGKPTGLELTRGTSKNGVYGTKTVAEPEKCAEYYFEATNDAGKVVRFPTTGVLLYACDKSWKEKSSSPGTDQPGTDQPGTDQPGTDQPGTDKPSDADSHGNKDDENMGGANSGASSSSDCSLGGGNTSSSHLPGLFALLAGLLIVVRRRKGRIVR